MNPFVRRVVRKLAGLPPDTVRQPTMAELDALSARIDAMDEGLQQLMHANREETRRALLRLRAELDAVTAAGGAGAGGAGAPADEPSAQEPSTTRPSNAS